MHLHITASGTANALFRHGSKQTSWPTEHGAKNDATAWSRANGTWRPYGAVRTHARSPTTRANATNGRSWRSTAMATLLSGKLVFVSKL